MTLSVYTLAVWLWLGWLLRVGGIVIATHSAEGILVGADSLEASQGVLVDQLYAQKIHQVSSTAYVCLSSFDAKGFKLCQNLRVMAKSAMLRGKALTVSELATYAQNLAGSMNVNPHFLVIGNEETLKANRADDDDDDDDETDQGCHQKIFEISPSGFMVEQDLAATGLGSNAALVLMDLTKNLDATDSPERREGFDPFNAAGSAASAVGSGNVEQARGKSSIRRTTRKIHKIIRALRASDANINGKVQIYLIPNKNVKDSMGIVSIKEE